MASDRGQWQINPLLDEAEEAITGQEGNALTVKPSKICFVIMPISSTQSTSEEEWTEIYGNLIKPAVENSGLGYTCHRSKAGRGNIIKDILTDLYQGHVVIAELTDKNPNVFYELGVRHTLRKRTLLICQKGDTLPFDLNSYCVCFYGWKTEPQRVAFRTEIRELLVNLEEEPDKADSPVWDFLAQRGEVLEDIIKRDNIAKLDALRHEAKSLLDHLVYQIKWLDDIGLYPSGHMSKPAVEFLIASRYLGPDVHEFYNAASAVNVSIDGYNSFMAHQTHSEKEKQLLTMRMLEMVLLRHQENISNIRKAYLNSNPLVEVTIQATDWIASSEFDQGLFEKWVDAAVSTLDDLKNQEEVKVLMREIERQVASLEDNPPKTQEERELAGQKIREQMAVVKQKIQTASKGRG